MGSYSGAGAKLWGRFEHILLKAKAALRKRGYTFAVAFGILKHEVIFTALEPEKNRGEIFRCL